MLKALPPTPGLASLDVDSQGFALLPVAGVAENFDQELPAAEAAVMATTQGPVQAGCFEQPVSVAAWENKPMWAICTAAIVLSTVNVGTGRAVGQARSRPVRV